MRLTFKGILSFLTTVAVLLLFVRADFLIGDPVYTQTTGVTPLPLYLPPLRGFVDLVYSVTDALVYPGFLISHAVSNMTPSLVGDYFPLLKMSTLFASLDKTSTGQAFKTMGLYGYIEWSAWISILFYWILNPVLSHACSLIKSSLLISLTEFLYTSKKELKYRKAVAEKSQALNEVTHQQKKLRSEVDTLSKSVVTDPLTQVYNRGFFSEKFRELFMGNKQSKQMLNLMMLDIDYFKKINDTHGHLIGDEVLVAVSSAVKSLMPSQGFCCRYGGEEFALVLPHLNATQAANLAEHIRHHLTTLRFSVDELRISASLGLASVDFMNAEPQARLHTQEDFIKLADDQLYTAKTGGRNQVKQVLL